MIDLLSYGFMQKAFLGGIAIALACGILGPFLVLRKLSLLGDGLAHLSFGGVAVGMLLGINPLLTALVAVAAGSLFVNKMIKKSIHGDAAISLILSFGVGLGIIIIGIVRGFGTDLFSYLIGSILSLTNTDLLLAGALLLSSIVFVWIFFRELLLLTFSTDLAELKIRRAKLINSVFILLVSFAVVISIRAVGILLVSALLVIPTLIALKVSTSFKSTLLYSSSASMLAALLGITLSFYLDLPPSGTIVMLLLGMYAVVFTVQTLLSAAGLNAQ